LPEQLVEIKLVAPDLNVHGLAGLRVIDASIMPRRVSGNTMTPT
jgi:choline dehydrogenase-like flavoprotein